MNSKAWQVATLVLALAAIGVGAYAFMQHGEVTALTTQLATTTADAKQAHDIASNLSAQLATMTKDAEQVRAEAAGLQNQVHATEVQASAEQLQLLTTEAKLAAETRPDLPVNLSFRKALMSAGLVGVFRNTSGKELEFTLDLESPATGQHVRKAVVLNSNRAVEIGAQQGWAFAPGQRITLNNPPYRPLQFTVGG
jgi:hypothetical protein